MAVRQPLYYNSSNQIQAMTTAMVDEVVDQIVYQYSQNPSVTLSVVGSSGSLDAMSDTRLQAGATSTSATAFPNEATTAEPSVVTVSYDKITETRTTVTPTADTGKIWPVYYNSSNQIQAMNLTAPNRAMAYNLSMPRRWVAPSVRKGIVRPRRCAMRTQGSTLTHPV